MPPFADTDLTVFVERRADGSIYGVWTVRQREDQEELLDSDPEVAAFRNRPVANSSISDGTLAAMLISKGVISRADVDTAIAESAAVDAQRAAVAGTAEK